MSENGQFQPVKEAQAQDLPGYAPCEHIADG